MKIGVGGCSHSSSGYGKPWHFYMGNKFDAKIVISSSSGQANEINIEKVKYIFEKNPDLDYFVLQLTEPSRFLLPLREDKKEDLIFLESPDTFNGMKFYSAKYNQNDQIIRKLTKIDVKFNDFFKNHVYTSDFNVKYKLIHTMMSIQHLSDHYNKKMIFFSWFVDVKKIAHSIGYESIINKMNVLDGCVDTFIKENNVQSLPNDSHYGSESHEMIFNQYIYPQIKDIIKQ
jgi:hypothetical protein